MGKLKVTDFYLYRWRYMIGFAAIATLLIALLLAVGLFIPGGVSKSEMASVTISDHTPPNVLLGEQASYVVHLPYHVLQKVSLQLFGVSPFSIKLPSLLLALGSVVMMYGLLRLWFRRNVAIITSVIVVTTGQFLLSSQSGTPEIGYLFWNAALLFSASMLARVNKLRPLWLIVVAVVGGLCLYSPLEIYVVASLAATCLIHPHARFIVFRQPIWVLLLSAVLFGLAVTPLVVNLIADPTLITTLLGLPKDFSIISWEHARNLIAQYIGWQPVSGAMIQPAFGVPILLLALLGLYRLFSAKYTAKSYIITIWAIFLIPVVLLQYSAVNFTFLPIILLVAFAIDFLIRSWYQLFPRNPYARVAGLLPLVVLVVGLTLSNVERFMYGYHYDPAARSAFSKDLTLANTTLKKLDADAVLVVPSEDEAFYTTYASRLKRDQNVIVTDSLSAASRHAKPILVSHEHHPKIRQLPDTIVVSDTASDAARFYLYKNGLK